MTDILQHTADIKIDNVGLPAFIYGHSMGGMIAVRTIMKNQAFYKVGGVSRALRKYLGL